MYLFSSITPADLDNLKLSNGLKIWEPLWACRQPNVKIFNTPVKQRNPNSSEEPEKLITEKQTSPKTKNFPENTLTVEKSKIEVKRHSNVSLSSDTTNTRAKGNFGDIYMGKDSAEVNKIDKQNSNFLTSNEECNKSGFLSNKLKQGTSSQLSQSTMSIPKSNSLIDKLDNLTDCEKSARDLENTTKLDQLKNNYSSKKYETDSYQISDIDSDIIRGSSYTLNEKAFTSFKAPIVHMSSICSFSEPSPQINSPMQMLNNNRDSVQAPIVNLNQVLETTTLVCPACNSENRITDEDISAHTLSCPNCFSSLKEVPAGTDKSNKSGESPVQKSSPTFVTNKGKKLQFDKKPKVGEGDDGSDEKKEHLRNKSNVKDATFLISP